MERGRRQMSKTDGKCTLRRSGKPDRLGFVLDRFGEPAELGEATDEPEAVEDACRCGQREILVEPIGWQHREVFAGKLHHLFVLAQEIMRLLELRRAEYAQPQVS